MTFDIKKVAENLLEPGERLLWTGQPEPGQVIRKVLIGCVLVLAAVFAESVSLLSTTGDDFEQLLGARVAALFFFTLVGAFLIYRVPLRAAKVIYALTDRRVLKLDLNRSVHESLISKVKHHRHAIICERRSLPEGFLLSAAINSFFFCIWTATFLPEVVASGDMFSAASIVLLFAAVGGYLYDRHLLPDPRWREAGGILFWIDNRCVFLQETRMKDVLQTKFRAGSGGIYDLFVVTKSQGCVRLSSINSPDDGPRQLLATNGNVSEAAGA